RRVTRRPHLLARWRSILEPALHRGLTADLKLTMLAMVMRRREATATTRWNGAAGESWSGHSRGCANIQGGRCWCGGIYTTRMIRTNHLSHTRRDMPRLHMTARLHTRIRVSGNF